MLLDSASGRIRHVAFFYSAEAAGVFDEALRAAFCALDADVRLSILTHASVRDRLSALVASCGRTADLVEAPDTLAFSIWARDALIAGMRNGESLALIPQSFGRYDDRDAARLLAEGVGLPVVKTDLPLEGGNQLVSQDAILIGADTANAMEGGSSALEELAGARKVIVLGGAPCPGIETRKILVDGAPWDEVIHVASNPGTHQPLFHIDLYVALAGRTADGRDRVVVGCPRLAARITGQGLPDHAQADAFDMAALQLAEAGMDVHRCPLPQIWIREVDKRRRTWIFLPYPNVWVRTDGPAPEVYLPGFAHPGAPGLAAMDRIVAGIWEGLGFRVKSIAGCLPLAENLGALNCMGNILARSPRTGAAP